jgi:nucleotidyltransferase/DNA polymerase involved in DNA repair
MGRPSLSPEGKKERKKAANDKWLRGQQEKKRWTDMQIETLSAHVAMLRQSLADTLEAKTAVEDENQTLRDANSQLELAAVAKQLEKSSLKWFTRAIAHRPCVLSIQHPWVELIVWGFRPLEISCHLNAQCTTQVVHRSQSKTAADTIKHCSTKAYTKVLSHTHILTHSLESLGHSLMHMYTCTRTCTCTCTCTCMYTFS